jgi:hypothetical protein
MSQDEARAQRAVARRGRVILHRARLGDERDLDPRSGVDGMALAAMLSETAWVATGQAWPERMDRAHVRFVRKS